MGNDSWGCPITEVEPGVVILGLGCNQSESTWVFQGILDEENSQQIVDSFKNSINNFRVAYLFPDNSLLDGGNAGLEFGSTNWQYCSVGTIARWRWREFLTGATVGAVVGGVVGSIVPGAGTVAGAAIGGAIGGALLGGGTAVVVDLVVDPNNAEDNYVNSAIAGAVGGAGGGYVGGVVGGALTAPAIPALGALPAVPGSGYIAGWIYRGQIVAAEVGGTHLGTGTAAGTVVGGTAIPGATPFGVVVVNGVPVVTGSVGFGGANAIPPAAVLIVKAAFGI